MSQCSGIVDCVAYTIESECSIIAGCFWTPDIVDPDGSPAACEAVMGVGFWNLGGNSASATTCCEDKGSEYKVVRESYWHNDGQVSLFWRDLGTSTSLDACCVSADNQLDYSGNCVSHYWSSSVGRKAVNTNYNGKDKYAVPYGAGWFDCDYSSNIVNNYCNYNGATICKGDGWEKAGEVVGEYLDMVTDGCCGDDAGEIFVTAGVGVSRCCNSVADCVDAGGSCQSGIAETIANGNCGNGIDDDCDGLTDFPNDPGCCTANEAGLCSDGIDNDCDTFTDCADSADCSEDSACCGYENSECCTSGDDCFGTLYCDTTYATDYCCDTGWFWNGAECVEGVSQCGLGGGSLCVSDISDFVSWYGDLDCYSQSSPFTGCCNVFQYNQWGYYDTSVTTY